MSIKRYIPNFIKDSYTNIKYYLFTKSNKIKVLTDEETIQNIVKNKKSIVRFGDGEFKWILGIKQKSFQNESKELSTRLKEVLKNKDDNILVCIPKGFDNVKGYTKSSSKFWKNFIRCYGTKINKYLDDKYYYGDACFTRWYMEHEDKSNMKETIQKLKEIWNDRELIIIEGKDTKMGIGNDLFDNCKNIKRIIAPSKNAFSKYDEILKEAKKIDKSKLILIALGPTATILAYDLAKEGYQALDIGHIDIEYEWYIRNADQKIPIPGKYVNEAGGIKEKKSDDEEYVKSIITHIGENNK